MLQQLQKTTETQDKISAVREELVELERSAQEADVSVTQLKRKNKDGSKRTALFLAENEKWKRHAKVDAARAKIVELQASEDRVWDARRVKVGFTEN